MRFTYRVCRWIALGFLKGVYGFKVYGREHMIEDSGAIIAVNHESFLDPPMVGSAYRNEISFLARKTLFNNRVFAWLLPKLNVTPVDQERPDFTSLKSMIRDLKSGKRAVIFPEGARTLDGSFQEVGPGVGLVIAKAGVPVQPVRVFGVYKALPRGAKWLRRSKLTIVAGKPFTFTKEELSSAKGKELYQHLAQLVMDRIAAIELPEGREFD